VIGWSIALCICEHQARPFVDMDRNIALPRLNL
jgi:hypothetical protein